MRFLLALPLLLASCAAAPALAQDFAVWAPGVALAATGPVADRTDFVSTDRAALSTMVAVSTHARRGALRFWGSSVMQQIPGTFYYPCDPTTPEPRQGMVWTPYPSAPGGGIWLDSTDSTPADARRAPLARLCDPRLSLLAFVPTSEGAAAVRAASDGTDPE